LTFENLYRHSTNGGVVADGSGRKGLGGLGGRGNAGVGNAGIGSGASAAALEGVLKKSDLDSGFYLVY
jgi:hypothetical protein